MLKSTDYTVRGLVAHLVCDWLLQNEWQANNKASLLHPASYVHAGIHLAGLQLVFPWRIALPVAISHLLIDTRRPLQWWAWLIRQTDDPANPVTLHINFWRDQVLHILIIFIAAIVAGRKQK